MLTEGFWEAAARGELVRPVCSACGRSFFTPQICCPFCLSEEWTYEPSSGRGVVYSATVAHRAPIPGFEPPYQVAIVDLEEGWHMLCNLTTAEPVAIGTSVRVVFRDGKPCFAPVGVAERLPTESRRDSA